MVWLRLRPARGAARDAAHVESAAEESVRREALHGGRGARGAAVAARARSIAELIRREWKEASVDASVPATLLLARVAEECEDLASDAQQLGGERETTV